MYVFAVNIDAKPIRGEVVRLSPQYCIDQYRQVLLRCVCRQELDHTSNYLLSLIVGKARPERCVRILCRIVLLDLDAGVFDSLNPLSLRRGRSDSSYLYYALSTISICSVCLLLTRDSRTCYYNFCRFLLKFVNFLVFGRIAV
jgi:hypothetical protein